MDKQFYIYIMTNKNIKLIEELNDGWKDLFDEI